MVRLTNKYQSAAKFALGLLCLLETSGCLFDESHQKAIIEENLGPGIQSTTYDVNAFPLNKVVCDPLTPGVSGGTNPQNGIKAKLFYRMQGMPRYYSAQDYVSLTQASGKDLFFKDMDVPTRMFDTGFASQTTEVLKNDLNQVLIEDFGLKMNTVIRLKPTDAEGLYEFSLLSDDGSIMKIKNPDDTWATYINNDGDHPTKMGCASKTINMSRRTRLEVEVLYYQGPRYHISNVLMWRKVANLTDAGKDPECGKLGNNYYFNPNHSSTPLAPYSGLLNRGWKVVDAGNFMIPGTDIDFTVNYNPCTEGQNPVISNLRIDEITLTDIWLNWDTDIPATAQVSIKDLSTGTTILTSSDNILRTQQMVHLSGLKNQTTYEIKAISVSDTLGKAISAPLVVTTP